jgi:hypothetical protein
MSLFLSMLCLLGQNDIAPRFTNSVGDVKVQPVAQSGVLELPYLTWGADVATFLANGDVDTTSGSIFDQHGLKFKLTNGDDFIQQVKNYMSGKTPFLRGEYTMVGRAAELLNQDPATKPIMILQLSWSAGDHMVGREGIKNAQRSQGQDDLSSTRRPARWSCR